MKKFAFLFFLTIGILISLPNQSLAAENLQKKIDSLEGGAVLRLENKTYEGNITINKPVEIIGQKGTVIKGDRTGNVISVRSPNVKIRNLTVINSSLDRNSPEEYAAIKVYTNHNLIDGVTIKHSFHGIYLSQAHHNTIKNCHITGLGKGQIANQGNGLHIYYANDNVLKNNVVQATRDGMFFDYANGNSIINNKISDTRYGLHYMYSDRNSFEDNTFTFNTGGAAIMNSNDIDLKNNKFIFNYGYKSFGLLLLQAQNTAIEDNIFFLNQRGLYLDQATNSSIKGNKIMKNQIGIELWASSNEQVFSLNDIEENIIPVATLGGEGRNSWSDKGKGNYWGNSFPVLDLNQDGIGDEPVAYQSSLYELIEDQELTYLFLKSPATQIYEKLNQFFHQDKRMFEDPHPLVKKEEINLGWFGWLIAGMILFVILIKGRQWICITFGRNGRKI
ncbi:nitrous oxide reductase family maturation protein NosD [Robertmurraya andreesenii]|uniref:Nitrous oxidase accessory protein n=1 Tax=Anoxybacillus andreesenii TaxID=1325932 RepID=A0ABT9V0E2_9BACL|nr:nitrous oxide reductase family maturation protein NosD [Robertmurraya andreesenii]MDQ0154383.1 nitrous oxidase accessory protein [Robertmurraya andreesenii]